MRDSIPAKRLKAARVKYETTSERPWHHLSAIEQQWWVDQTPTPKEKND